MGPVATEIYRRLESAFNPMLLTVTDDSASHFGHGGYREGIETHLSVKIVSSAFTGKTRLERQRLVYTLLGDLMENPIHALHLSVDAP